MVARMVTLFSEVCLALALKYPLLHSPVACSVVGIRTREQINSLDEVFDDMQKIDLSVYADLIEDMPTIRYEV